MKNQSSTPKVSMYSYKGKESELQGCSNEIYDKIDLVFMKKYKDYKGITIHLSYEQENPDETPYVDIYLALKKNYKYIGYIGDYEQFYNSTNLNNLKKKLVANQKYFIKIRGAGHVYLCFIDKNKKTIETIDAGEYSTYTDFIPVLYRKIIVKLFYKIFGEYYTYYHHDINILLITQMQKEVKNKGFCYAYLYYFTEEKLKHPTKSMASIVRATIKKVSENPCKFGNFIIGYAEYLHKL